MAKLIRETSAALRTIIIGAFVLAFMFCVAGIWLVYLGATGSTEFTFFGQAFKSANVGIAALFLGAVSVVLLLRRTLRSLDIAINAEVPKESSVPIGHWPRTQTFRSLENKVKSLSENQWLLLKTVAQHEGKSAYSLDIFLNIGPSMLFHRLDILENQGLIIMKKADVYLAPKVRELLGGKNIDELRE
jgi:hypothetical protein